MKYAEKWRETLINPQNTTFPCGLNVKKVLGYPHAGNDVFTVLAEVEEGCIEVVLKYERQTDADLSREFQVIQQLQGTPLKYPKVVGYGVVENRPYLATVLVEGQRISQWIQGLDEEASLRESMKYMERFGENLGKIHALKKAFSPAKERKFMHIMDEEKAKTLNLTKVYQWLVNNAPNEKSICFVHGDHHYANVLWDRYEIQCTLDWELSGMGWKEFDIAWAIIHRPSQTFLKTTEEHNAFLKGYTQYQTYDKQALLYCMVLIYQYFYEIGRNIKDEIYCSYVERFFKSVLNTSSL